MKTLVTGGTGLLGGRLIPKLVKGGYQIFALTRFRIVSRQTDGNGRHTNRGRSRKRRASGIARDRRGCTRSRPVPLLRAARTFFPHQCRRRRSPAGGGRGRGRAHPHLHQRSRRHHGHNAGSPIRNADEGAPHSRTISPPIWRARHRPSCWCWPPKSPAFAPLPFARPRSGDRAIRSAAGFPPTRYRS
jgi:hypothetical protein